MQDPQTPHKSMIAPIQEEHPDIGSDDSFEQEMGKRGNNQEAMQEQSQIKESTLIDHQINNQINSSQQNLLEDPKRIHLNLQSSPGSSLQENFPQIDSIQVDVDQSSQANIKSAILHESYIKQPLKPAMSPQVFNRSLLSAEKQLQRKVTKVSMRDGEATPRLAASVFNRNAKLPSIVSPDKFYKNHFTPRATQFEEDEQNNSEEFQSRQIQPQASNSSPMRSLKKAGSFTIKNNINSFTQRAMNTGNQNQNQQIHTHRSTASFQGSNHKQYQQNQQYSSPIQPFSTSVPFDQQQPLTNNQRMKQQFKYNLDLDMFDDRYRRIPVVGSECQLTSGYYSMLQRKVDLSKVNNIESQDFKSDPAIEQQYLQMMLQDSAEEDPIDTERVEREGPKAVKNYYEHYKKLGKIQQENKLRKVQSSLLTSVFKKSQKKLLPPIKMGLVQMSKVTKSLNLNNHKIGNKYAQVLASSNKYNLFTEMNLRNNNISQAGAHEILATFNKNVKKIDLSENKIGSSILILRDILTPDYNLIELNLSQNKLGAPVVIKLLDILQTQSQIKKLNLSENMVSDACCPRIKEFLTELDTVEEFYLRWNQISAIGAQHVIEGLQAAQQMRVMDFAWNNLGSNLGRSRQNPELVPLLCDYLVKNKQLRHLDLSSNDFTTKESRDISQALSKNHTIYGFHFDGNFGTIDEIQNLVVEEKTFVNNYNIHLSQKIDSTRQKDTQPRMNQYDQLVNVKDICWICDGWVEILFEFQDECDKDDLVLLHFRHEGYTPICLTPAESGERMIYICCPNTRLFFFFTINGQILVSECYPSIYLTQPEVAEYKLGDQKRRFDIEQINVMEFEMYADPIINKSYDPTIVSLPRKPRTYIPAKLRKTRPPWDFNKSIFKDWRKEDERLLLKCFQHDWDNTRLESFLKHPEIQSEVKELLSGYYEMTKNAYRYQSSLSGTDKIWQIGKVQITDILNQMGVSDNVITIQASDLEFANAVFTSKKFKNNPKGQIVRHEFLEFLTRISIKKYEGQDLTIPQCIKKMWQAHVLPFGKKYELQSWRDKRYWTEEVDWVLTKHVELLKEIYANYSGERSMPGQAKFMCLDEFRRLLLDMDLENLISEREIPVYYNLSMMTQYDEVNSDRFFEMSFVEFIEAFCRGAEKAALPCVGLSDELIEKMDMKKRESYPFQIKIEAFLFQALQKVVSAGFRKKYQGPKKSLFLKNGDIIEDANF